MGTAADVSVSSFVEKAGEAYASEILRLWERAGMVGMVLFSNDAGTEIAVLPYGPASPVPSFETAMAVDYEGLRPLLHALTRQGEREREEQQLRIWEARVRLREAALQAAEERLQEELNQLAEREAALVQREERIDLISSGRR